MILHVFTLLTQRIYLAERMDIPYWMYFWLYIRVSYLKVGSLFMSFIYVVKTGVMCWL